MQRLAAAGAQLTAPQVEAHATFLSDLIAGGWDPSNTAALTFPNAAGAQIPFTDFGGTFQITGVEAWTGAFDPACGLSQLGGANRLLLNFTSNDFKTGGALRAGNSAPSSGGGYRYTFGIYGEASSETFEFSERDGTNRSLHAGIGPTHYYTKSATDIRTSTLVGMFAKSGATTTHISLIGNSLMDRWSAGFTPTLNIPLVAGSVRNSTTGRNNQADSFASLYFFSRVPVTAAQVQNLPTIVNRFLRAQGRPTHTILP